jgi:hypothetical protein
MEVGLIYENAKWMELAHYRVQWQALASAVLNLRVLLSTTMLVICKLHFKTALHISILALQNLSPNVSE